jgi:hypothetical protein
MIPFGHNASTSARFGADVDDRERGAAQGGFDMRQPQARAASFLLFTVASLAAGAAAADSAQTIITPKDMKWGPAPPSLPRGAQVAVLKGDPGKAGPFVIRVMTPGPYRIAPHWHSQDEDVTVISGTFYLGLGDSGDAKTAHRVPAGGFHALPAKAHHYAFSKTRTVVQIAGNGPFDITYAKPEDDPQKKM